MLILRIFMRDLAFVTRDGADISNFEEADDSLLLKKVHEINTRKLAEILDDNLQG